MNKLAKPKKSNNFSKVMTIGSMDEDEEIPLSVAMGLVTCFCGRSICCLPYFQPVGVALITTGLTMIGNDYVEQDREVRRQRG
ncbi:MAG: hypothetical protein WDZ27_03900 [Waddliaceae bacterium]